MVIVEYSRAEKDIIDLGDLEVIGEVRRPHLFMVESRRELEKIVRESAKQKWERFEQELTQPRDRAELRQELQENWDSK